MLLMQPAAATESAGISSAMLGAGHPENPCLQPKQVSAAWGADWWCSAATTCLQACQNPRRCAAEVAQVAKVDAWLAKALSKLHACQLLPELPDLVVQPAV